MARITRDSKAVAKSNSELPAWMSEGAALLDALQAGGAVGEIGARCVIRREGGYAGVDVVLFLLAYFATNISGGLRQFYANARPRWRQLAAIAGRAGLPSPPAMSRALSCADSEKLRSFERWLLTDVLGTGPLLTHPASQHRDAVGRPWQVFHFDPTVPALRQRALPAREGLPEGERRAAAIGQAGKSGRKRGEVVFTRSVLQHAGTGLWFDMRVEPGHGDQRHQLDSALDAVVHVCGGIGHPVEFALTCADGQWGGIPSIAAFRERNTRFVTRCSRYSLLETPEVRRALRHAAWTLVPDSGSGPQRGCADAGWVWLEPGDETRRADGSDYQPERVRLVVTRYPRPEDARKSGRGRVIDGVAYELFITDLDEEGWPAADVCATYFGRCGQEIGSRRRIASWGWIASTPTSPPVRNSPRW